MALRVALGCALLAVLSGPAASSRLRLEGNSGGPTQAQINAAEKDMGSI